MEQRRTKIAPRHTGEAMDVASTALFFIVEKAEIDDIYYSNGNTRQLYS
ncbi:MAG: hypothetical protein ACI39E_04560 [Acutalibacteraceae bacterium]